MSLGRPRRPSPSWAAAVVACVLAACAQLAQGHRLALAEPALAIRLPAKSADFGRGNASRQTQPPPHLSADLPVGHVGGDLEALLARLRLGTPPERQGAMAHLYAIMLWQGGGLMASDLRRVFESMSSVIGSTGGESRMVRSTAIVVLAEISKHGNTGPQLLGDVVASVEEALQSSANDLAGEFLDLLATVMDSRWATPELIERIVAVAQSPRVLVAAEAGSSVRVAACGALARVATCGATDESRLICALDALGTILASSPGLNKDIFAAGLSVGSVALRSIHAGPDAVRRIVDICVGAADRALGVLPLEAPLGILAAVAGSSSAEERGLSSIVALAERAMASTGPKDGHAAMQALGAVAQGPAATASVLRAILRVATRRLARGPDRSALSLLGIVAESPASTEALLDRILAIAGAVGSRRGATVVASAVSSSRAARTRHRRAVLDLCEGLAGEHRRSALWTLGGVAESPEAGAEELHRVALLVARLGFDSAVGVTIVALTVLGRAAAHPAVAFATLSAILEVVAANHRRLQRSLARVALRGTLVAVLRGLMKGGEGWGERRAALVASGFALSASLAIDPGKDGRMCSRVLEFMLRTPAPLQEAGPVLEHAGLPADLVYHVGHFGVDPNAARSFSQAVRVCTAVAMSDSHLSAARALWAAVCLPVSVAAMQAASGFAKVAKVRSEIWSVIDDADVARVAECLRARPSEAEAETHARKVLRVLDAAEAQHHRWRAPSPGSRALCRAFQASVADVQAALSLESSDVAARVARLCRPTEDLATA